ncbi:hypothetical protein JEQ12_019329 [Ovis aries]|uniref:Uncharacterized protein n=1 Tax=Ovis aries TaxID=9940 RepID=A0A836D0F8_SHEEP|nr:hypothetical protein JEQ12_019329 [Ovis aries]
MTPDFLFSSEQGLLDAGGKVSLDYTGICGLFFQESIETQKEEIWSLEEKTSLEKEISMEVRNEDKGSHEETVKPDVAHHRLESVPEEVLESVGPRGSLIQTLKRAMRKMDTISTDLPAI